MTQRKIRAKSKAQELCAASSQILWLTSCCTQTETLEASAGGERELTRCLFVEFIYLFRLLRVMACAARFTYTYVALSPKALFRGHWYTSVRPPDISPRGRDSMGSMS